MIEMMRFAFFFSTLCALNTLAIAQTSGPTTVSTQPIAMDKDALAPIYQRELGEKYDPAKLDELYRAHVLIESYFAKGGDRKQITKDLEATGIDPNILGRITRVRMNWPELPGGIYYINERYGPHVVKYFLGIPKNYDRSKPWPMVIKLPAADTFVRPPKPTADMVVIFYRDWMIEEIKLHPDAIVMMPLLNLDELYGPSYAGMHTVIQPMLHAYDRVNIDPARVYLVGHSMSAHAVWNISLHYPMYFAAINPLAGGAKQEWQRIRLMNLRNLLAVVWHDSTDKLINVRTSRELVGILRRMKIDVDYTETTKIGHVPTSEIIHKLYEKMRSRTRELYPQRITLQSNRPDTIFNRIDWAQIWQPINPGDEQWLIISRGRGHMVTYANGFKLDATRSGNRIDATTDNVAGMRFYFNDQMIDFKQPVTINVNKKGAFEKIISPSVDEMLKDQLFIGRGWRYFTAAVDIDVLPRAPETTKSSK